MMIGATRIWPACGALLVLALVAATCGGDDKQEPSPEAIQVPEEAVDQLVSFAFTTKLEIISAEGDLTVRFEGAFQAPDRIEGTLQLGGELGQVFQEAFGNPEIEAVVIGEQAWWRVPGESWQASLFGGGDSVDPLVTFRQYATPWFYMDALQFELLTLATAGPRETIDGVATVPVRLDKAGIVELLPQGTALKLYPDQPDEPGPVFPGEIGNAQQVLPRDFIVEVWFAEDGLYPARILFDYPVTEEDSSNLAFGFAVPVDIRLQMDITDPDAGVSIEPPLPVPATATPITESSPPPTRKVLPPTP